MVVLLRWWRRVVVVAVGWLAIHMVSGIWIPMVTRVVLGLMPVHGTSHSMHMHVSVWVWVHMGIGISHVMMLPLVFVVLIINIVFDRVHAIVLVCLPFIVLLFFC